ncbi:large conductance mechanosensitive channel protein MscL [Bacillus timonensis]|uniref:Large-conductance mechanosensitive channel n=1 Tax=Bacillus timonensis TaxID=1033734 RepID=A0A4S3PSL9_9BACI|nr:large conductance mechanosensitive channel protein MscL [Bacillus timonensis]THE11822.1 large conductance mechanosensitive channel protein MscL [Bacillus timonensis]
MLNEFKKFALKGNVIDLAVGVIIGGAFGKIVTSLVNDIIMPLIGFLLGGVNISEASIPFNGEEIMYGAFLQTVLDFLIISFSIFLFIRFFQRFKKKEEEKPTAEPTPTKEEQLLAEIRDLLKEQKRMS